MRGVLSIERTRREPPGPYRPGIRGQFGAAQSHEAAGAGSVSTKSAFDPGWLGHRGESSQRLGQGAVCDPHSGVDAAVSRAGCSGFETESAGIIQVAEPTRGLLKTTVLALLGFYKSTLSPAIPSSCRFCPTCSAYAYEAVSQWGVQRGIWLAVRRVVRCRPFGSFGYDPVPQSSVRSS
jgi:uncharacterized protein